MFCLYTSPVTLAKIKKQALLFFVQFVCGKGYFDKHDCLFLVRGGYSFTEGFLGVINTIGNEMFY